jgi:hypothetical protein
MSRNPCENRKMLDYARPLAAGSNWLAPCFGPDTRRAIFVAALVFGWTVIAGTGVLFLFMAFAFEAH